MIKVTHHLTCLRVTKLVPADDKHRQSWEGAREADSGHGLDQGAEWPDTPQRETQNRREGCRLPECQQILHTLALRDVGRAKGLRRTNVTCSRGSHGGQWWGPRTGGLERTVRAVQ